ncbi:PHP domain-containing protein [Proteiniborus sp. MB09-C3]|uniref:PHP domain-containing protein n=1 Tax=Proteiniborus sp. MB09-C3 TaxID=3050072 RepID=UPI0025552B18|nr:PHP domain-containing protein [Proteiniborus sp. MB09-C3]WIV10921.1 PHP domain-containing protein [Proteiniborus sp. MB09-C3]
MIADMNAIIKKSDLHVHTTFSDGSLAPLEVIKWASKKKIYAIAITDHDTIEGVKYAIENTNLFDITIIPGIEISCIFEDEEVHLLGYYIDIQNIELLETLKLFKESRESRGEKIVEKLNRLEFNLTLQEVFHIAGKGVIGRPHIAKAMINRNYVDTVQEAFDKYLNKHKPAYVDRFRVSLKEGINLIHNAGGAAVIAHPGLIKNEKAVNEAISMGIDGIEAIHSKHSSQDVMNYSKIAKDNNLIITGGSDFHGDFINNVPALGDFFIDYSHVELLFSKANFYKERREF